MNISLIPNKRVDTIHASQFDTSRSWEFQLISNDALVTPTGSVSLICDQTEVPVVVLPTGALRCGSSFISDKPGIHKCKIKIEDGNEVLYSSLFYLHVEVRP